MTPYLVKNTSKDELLLAIKSVFTGQVFVSPGISDKVIDEFPQQVRAGRKSSLWKSLTDRERQILKLIAKGHSNSEIADKLSVSVKTVETHRSNIMDKIGLNNSAKLTAYSIKRELLAEL